METHTTARTSAQLVPWAVRGVSETSCTIPGSRRAPFPASIIVMYCVAAERPMWRATPPAYIS